MTASAAPGKRGGLGSVLSFLCIIPVRSRRGAGAQTADPHDDLDGAARNMHLFPLAGMIIGVIPGLLAWGLLAAGLEPLIVGLLAAVALLVVTGLHHTDGLADMADGLMTRGDQSRRLEAMRDKATGTGGTAAVVMCIAGLIIAISALQDSPRGGVYIMIYIVLAEVAAKCGMVVMALVGHAAPGSGSGATFVGAVKENRLRCIIAVAVSAVLLTTALDSAYGISVLALCLLVPVVLARIAEKHFGGVTGDVFGAANDIVRVGALVVLTSL